MPELTLGVDLSDVIPRLAVVDAGGQILSRAEGPSSASADANAIRDAVKRVVAGLSAPVAAAGVAMPSAFDEVPPAVAACLREATSRDTVIVPIAAGTAAAIAEQWMGAARGLKQVVTISIGEHVVAGVILNGEPWLGAHGFASSAGWLAMNPVEREDYRRLGGLEAEIASAGIVRRFVWRIKSGDESPVADQVKGDFSKITADDILQASRSGDGVAISIVRDTAKYVGMAAANMATLFDPETIVLGGVIAQSGDVMLDAIKTECSRRLHREHADVTRLVLSTLGHDAAAMGAARAAARAGACSSFLPAPISSCPIRSSPAGRSSSRTASSSGSIASTPLFLEPPRSMCPVTPSSPASSTSTCTVSKALMSSTVPIR
jgi:glucokinase